tara:strand:- start:25421 stop:25654 length:234 start_codon:yes stop_codon:yes gene_type:complete
MKILLSTALISALLTGCATQNTPPDLLSFDSPANTQTAIRSTRYYNVIGDYSHRVPVEPKPWRKLNDDQAPKTGAGA